MTEPSEAAMRDARELLKKIVGKPYELHIIAVAEALDRHAAAERERGAKIADNLYQYQWRKDEYIYRGNVAAAIRGQE